MNFLDWFLKTKKLKLNILKLRNLCILTFIAQIYENACPQTNCGAFIILNYHNIR